MKKEKERRYLSSTGQTFCTASVKLSMRKSRVTRGEHRSERWVERRTTFVKHVSKSSTTKDDISLDDEGKAVPARDANPVVLARARSSRHD